MQSQRQRCRPISPNIHQVLPGWAAGAAGGTAVLQRLPAGSGAGHSGRHSGRCLSVQRRGSPPPEDGKRAKCEENQWPHLTGTAGAGSLGGGR